MKTIYLVTSVDGTKKTFSNIAKVAVTYGIQYHTLWRALKEQDTYEIPRNILVERIPYY